MPAVFERQTFMKWLITFALSGAILLIPVTDTFTSDMRTFLAITIFGLCIAAFEFFDIFVPSIFLPTAYLVSGCLPIEAAFSGWTTTVIWICFGAFLLAHSFDEIGLLNRIAYWVILKSGGTFNRTMLGLMLAGVVLTIITFGNSYIIMITLGYGICKSLDLGKSKDSALMMFAALIGSMTTRGVIYAPTNLSLINAGAQALLPDFELTWLQQWFYCWPILIVTAVLYVLLVKLRKNSQAVDSSAFIRQRYEELGPMSVKEKKGLAVLAIMLIYLLTQPLHGLPMDYGFMVLPWLLVLPGVRVATGSCFKRFDFGMIFFAAACIAIGTGAARLGIGALFSSMVTPILSPLPASLATLSVFLLGTILNFFMTPLAFLAGFSTPITQIAVDLGINPAGPLFMLNFACDAIFLPYEYIPYLIAYSFGVMTMQDFLRLNIYKFVVVTLGLLVLMLPYWLLVGLL